MGVVRHQTQAFKQVLAELGARARTSDDFDRFLAETVRDVADAMELDCCSVFELMPAGGKLWRRAVAGCSVNTAATVVVDAGLASQAGYTLIAGHPVVASDLAGDPRFSAQQAVAAGLCSGATVVIGDCIRPYGVLGAHQRRAYDFTADEVAFLTAVADLLAVAVENHAPQRTIDDLHQPDALEAVGRLAAGMAHDLDALLALIVGGSGLLRQLVEPGNARATLLLQQVERAGVRASGQVRRLLAFLQSSTAEPRTIDANAALRDLAPTLGQGLDAAILVELDLSPDAWPCLADPGELDGALINLVANARDAMPDGGRLVLTTRNVTIDGAMPDEQPAPGDYLAISVADTGSGMSPEVRDRAFEPFFTTKSADRGSGTGLTAVYGFVRRSGGHASIATAEGAGTRVDLYLPRAAGAVPADSGELRASRIERILLVGRDPLLRAAGSRLLEQHAFLVEQAPDVPAALARLSTAPAPALVVADMAMPGGGHSGMDGWDLAQAAWRRRPDLPVLLLTAPAGGEAAEGTEAQPRIRVMERPFGSRALLDAVRLALHQS